MSLAKRIVEAIDKMASGDHEGAMIPVCIVVAATARKENPRMEDGRAFKTFISENMPLITAVSFGGTTIGHIRLNYRHSRVKPGADGLASLEDILYHAVRCSLLHEGKLPDNLTLTNDGTQSILEDGALALPGQYANGMLVAAISSRTNNYLTLPKEYMLNMENKPSVPLFDLCGRREYLRKVLGL